MLVSTTHRFCVYTHSINGVVFYVGKGPMARAFDLNHRGKLWKQHTAGREFEVTIASLHLTDAEAIEAEISMIKRLKPACNLMHNTYTVSQERRDALSAMRKGVKRRPEHAQAMRDGWARIFAEGRANGTPRYPIRCNETGEIFRSMTYAAAAMGLDKASVRNCVLGKQRVHRGYSFTRITDPAPVANHQRELCCRKAEDLPRQYE